MRLRSIVSVLILAWLITVIILLARYHDQAYIISTIWSDSSGKLHIAEKGGPPVGDLKHQVLTRAAEDARLADELMEHLAGNSVLSQEPLQKSKPAHSSTSKPILKSSSRSKVEPKSLPQVQESLALKLPQDLPKDPSIIAAPIERHAAMSTGTALHATASVSQQIDESHVRDQHSSPPTLNPASVPHAATTGVVLPRSSAAAEEVLTAGDLVVDGKDSIRIESQPTIPAKLTSMPGAASVSLQYDESSPKDLHTPLSVLKQTLPPHAPTLAGSALHGSSARIEDVLTASVARSGEAGSGPAAKKKQSSSCTRVLLDDGYGAIPNTYVVVGQEPSSSTPPQLQPSTPLLLEVVPGELCAAKAKCQASVSCAGFVWWAALQEAQLLRRLPPKDQWKSHSEGTKTAAPRRQLLGQVDPDQSQVALSHARQALSSTSSSTGSGSEPMPQGRHKRKSSAELKKEAKDRAQAMASNLQQQQVGLGPVLYAKLASSDTLTHLLGHYDRRPQLQVAMSGVLAPAQEAEKRTAANASVCSGSGLPGHPRAEYDVYRTAGEWWTDMNRAETIDGGICAVKAACAADDECHGFVFRARDGAGLLGKKIKIMDYSSKTVRLKLQRFEKKAPRGVFLYVKRPNWLKFGKATHINGQEVDAPTTPSLRAHKSNNDDPGSSSSYRDQRKRRGGAGTDAAATPAAAEEEDEDAEAKALRAKYTSPWASRLRAKRPCLNLEQAPWSGSPPLTDPHRRPEDPEWDALPAHRATVEASYFGVINDSSGVSGGSLATSSSSSLGGSLSSLLRGGSSSGGSSTYRWSLGASQTASAAGASAGSPAEPTGPTKPSARGRTPVWISLTTLPGRIDQIERTVMSLVQQTVPADEVVISVPAHSEREGRAYVTPSWLNALVNSSRISQARPLVRLRHIEKDYGPATKLIPSVMEAHSLSRGDGSERGTSTSASSRTDSTGDARGRGNVLLLVCDDDTLYPPRLLETLLEWHTRLPHAALAFSGWPVVAKTYRYPHWSENYLVYGNELFAPHPVSIIRGNTGYLVQSKFFDDQLWLGYSNAPPGAFFMDDVWISGRLANAKVKRFVVPFDEDQFTMTPNLSNVTTLDHVELRKPAGPSTAPETVNDLASLPEVATSSLHASSTSSSAVMTNEQDIHQGTLNIGGGRRLLAAPKPNNRVQANEQALKHFKKDWDVLWDGEKYRLLLPAPKQKRPLVLRSGWL